MQIYLDFSRILSRFLPPVPALGSEMSLEFSHLVEGVRDDCVKFEFSASHKTAERLIDELQGNSEMAQVLKLSEELLGRIRDEMSERFFFSLSLHEAKQYAETRTGWEHVIERFPETVRDIEEAGKCLALARPTASVFHLMRVSEVGLRALGKSLNNSALDPKTNPAWERILQRCDAELLKQRGQRSAEWQTDDTFFATATANLRAIKDAWRNPTLHVEKFYSDEEAGEVYSAVRAFMRQLATKL